jgi:hypothetical protein
MLLTVAYSLEIEDYVDAELAYLSSLLWIFEASPK